jgi:uncharacterized protein (DUF1800 family)
VLAEAAVATSAVGPRLARFAINRLGYGPRPESIEEILSRGLERWIEGQLQPKPDGDTESRMRSFPDLAAPIGDVAARYEADPRSLAQLYLELRSAHFMRAVHSPNQLEEVLTDFWFNHFNVNAGEVPVRIGLPRYEYDTIRPYVLGKFRDLLGAVAASWSMMLYLDNAQSVARNINENYARELMELHTLGVDGGYTQFDVQEVARAFTGWGVDRRAGAFSYRDSLHDQGAKTVLGTGLPARQGRKDGEDVLDLLARHPSTAHFISLKLARRFVSDTPSDALVDRCAETFRNTGGDIAAVLRTIVSASEFWAEAFGGGKIKTPHEYVVSALRAVGAEVTNARNITDSRGGNESLASMGMPTYEALDPTGWSNRGSDWIPNPGSHLARMNFVLALVSQTIDGISVDLRGLLGGADPGDATAVTAAVDRRIFADLLPAEVVAACARVGGSGSLLRAFKVVGLALASPTFQVR